MTLKLIKAGVATLALLAASLAAGAAELPVKAPIYKAPLRSVVSYYNWTGFYAGINAGYGFGTSTWSLLSTGDIKPKGVVAGGTLGYNWQSGMFVAGIEADGAWANINNTATLAGVTATAKIDALATVRGRIGAAFNQIMLYGTGGLAVADTKVSATALGITVSDSKTQTGWTAGAGIEWMFIPRWSLKAEYLYRRFDNVTLFGVSTGNIALNSGQVGVNFHF